MELNLKKQFMMLGALLILVAACSAYLNSENNRLAAAQQVAVLVVQRHMDADMKHDGIRGNVYSSLVASQLRNASMLKASQTEIDEMVTSFNDNVEQNLKSDVPPHIKQQFLKIQQSVKQYGDYSRFIAQQATDFTKASKSLPQFDQVFGVLEEDQGKASEQILAWSQSLQQESSTISLYFQWVLGVICLLAVGVPVFAIWQIFKPLDVAIACMQALSDGKTNVQVPYQNRRNELGKMAKTIQVFKNNAIEKAKLADHQKELEANLKQSLDSAETQLKAALAKVAEEQIANEQRAEAERRQTREDLAHRFEQTVQGIIKNVVVSSNALTSSTTTLNKTIGLNTQQSFVIAESAEKTTCTVDNIAAAVEEMSATVSQIAEQMIFTSQAVQEAVEQVEKADTTSTWLDNATVQIDKIVDSINVIASQINLLALNATIESASAGDAGKGFAVVANEVKLLATQTREAINEVSEKVTNIKGASSQMIEALQGIKRSISSVNAISTSVSTAIEQQNAASQEISKNMAMAAQSVKEINENINGITKASDEAGTAAANAVATSSNLSTESDRLSTEVQQFLVAVRQG